MTPVAIPHGIWTMVSGLRAIFFIIALMTVAPAMAQTEYQLIRRVAVFPFQIEAAYQASAEEAWWTAREELSKGGRFLVASKQFLLKSDVYQARGPLEPADAILLSRLVDAHCLVTGFIKDRKYVMTAYDGTYGNILWQKELALHPSIAISDQLASSARKLIEDFMASIPYQGFQVVDSMVGRPVYEEGDVTLSQVDIGLKSGIQSGDIAQWIRLVGTNTKNLFQGGAQMSVFAEGRVVKVEQNIATIEVLRATKIAGISEFTLVRFPKEAERLQSEYKIHEGGKLTRGTDLLSPESQPMEQISRERRPLITALSFLGSIAGYLLLAF